MTSGATQDAQNRLIRRQTLILCHEVIQARSSKQLTKRWIVDLRDSMAEMLGQSHDELPDADHGSVYTLAEFKSHVVNGLFIDYDGTGYYATAEHETAIPCRPSDIRAEIVISGYSHVTWYNR